jgi:hypothetical protein
MRIKFKPAANLCQRRSLDAAAGVLPLTVLHGVIAKAESPRQSHSEMLRFILNGTRLDFSVRLHALSSL